MKTADEWADEMMLPRTVSEGIRKLQLIKFISRIQLDTAEAVRDVCANLECRGCREGWPMIDREFHVWPDEKRTPFPCCAESFYDTDPAELLKEAQGGD